jgi:hypothetical protein
MSTEPRDLFMPMTMKAWGTAYGFPRDLTEVSVAELTGVPGSVGFIPLYDSIEAMQAVHGLVPFQRLRGVVMEEALRDPR